MSWLAPGVVRAIPSHHLVTQEGKALGVSMREFPEMAGTRPAAEEGYLPQMWVAPSKAWEPEQYGNLKEGRSMRFHASLVPEPLCFLCCHYLRISNSWFFSTECGFLVVTPGGPGLQPVARAASLFPHILRLQASRIEWPLVSLALQLTDSHCGPRLWSHKSIEEIPSFIVICTLDWLCSSREP